MNMVHEKRRLNVVFTGHAGAGKSTIGGQILCLTGQLNNEEIAEANRSPNSYLADMMRQYDGLTKAHAETESTRFTILDVLPSNYEVNMIRGLLKADVSVLVISARRGEIDRGFLEDFWLPFPVSGRIITEDMKNKKFRKVILGRTRKHVEFAKKLGVKLIVLLNKMDEVNWAEERYIQIIQQKMAPFLELTGYNMKEDVVFLPTSGLFGINIHERVGQNICPWWRDQSFFEVLDSVKVRSRDPNGPFRMPIVGKYIGQDDHEAYVLGTVGCGSIWVGDYMFIMPNQTRVRVVAISCNGNDVERAGPLDNVTLQITGVEVMDICTEASFLSSITNPVSVVTQFDAEIEIIERTKAIIQNKCRGVLLINHATFGFEVIEISEQGAWSMFPRKKDTPNAGDEECDILKMMNQTHVETTKPIKCRIEVSTPICVEKYADFPQFGRFVLRSLMDITAVGKVIDF